MIRTIVVEDEKHAADLLSQIIKEHCLKLSLLGCASKREETLDLIKATDPQLIFLDIQLSDCTAFDILDSLEETNFKVIFTTAYDQYAIKAFEYKTIDYILKPFAPKDIISAVQKLDEDQYNFQELKKLTMQLADLTSNRIGIQTLKGISMIDIKDVVSVEASGSYATIHMNDYSTLLTSKPLKNIEERLPSAIFLRVHASHLVNVNQILEFEKDDGGELIMKNNSRIPVSRRKRKIVIDSLLT